MDTDTETTGSWQVEGSFTTTFTNARVCAGPAGSPNTGSFNVTHVPLDVPPNATSLTIRYDWEPVGLVDEELRFEFRARFDGEAVISFQGGPGSTVELDRAALDALGSTLFMSAWNPECEAPGPLVSYADRLEVAFEGAFA